MNLQDIQAYPINSAYYLANFISGVVDGANNFHYREWHALIKVDSAFSDPTKSVDPATTIGYGFVVPPL